MEACVLTNTALFSLKRFTAQSYPQGDDKHAEPILEYLATRITKTYFTRLTNRFEILSLNSMPSYYWRYSPTHERNLDRLMYSKTDVTLRNVLK